MKISQVSHIKPLLKFFPHIKSSKLPQTKEDSFERNNLHTPEEKYSALENELIEYALNSSQIDFSKLQEIISRYSKTSKIYEFSEIESEYKDDETGAFVLLDDIDFYEEDGEYKVSPFQHNVVINTSCGFTSKEQKADFMRNLLHEMVHVFQDESSNHLSNADFLANALNEDDSDLRMFTVAIENDAFLTLDNAIYKIVNHFLRSANALERRYSLDEIFKKETKKSSFEAIGFMIEKIIERLQEQEGELDVEYLKKYILFCAKREKEANQKAYKSVQKIFPQSNSDLKKHIQIYDDIIFNILKSFIEKDPSFENKLNLFKKELIDYANANETLSLAYLQRLIQVFSPDTKIKKQSVITYPLKRILGTVNLPYVYKIQDDELIIKKAPKIIQIQGDLEKDDLIRMIIHEMTHVLQYEDEKKDYFREIIRLANENILRADTLLSSEDMFFEMEEILFSMLKKVFNDANKIDKNEVKRIFIKVIEKYKKEVQNFDLSSALKIIKIKVLNEIEACKNEFSYNQDKMTKDEKMEYEAIFRMYEVMLEIIDELED